MKNKRINTGLEVECILNIDKTYPIRRIAVGHYHRGIKISKLGWYAERDSSVVIRSIDINNLKTRRCIPVEIISPTFKTKKEFMEGIDNFINFFSNNGEYKLKEVLSFNNSCGAHIHFSIPYHPRKFSKKATNTTFIKTRQRFFKLIKKNKLPKTILDNYFRDYSLKVMPKDKRNYLLYERNKEFNLYSEHCNKGLEWRAPNMIGITTWKQFRKFWNIVFECIEYMIENYRIWKKEEENVTEIEKNAHYKKYLSLNKEKVQITDEPQHQSDLSWLRYRARTLPRFNDEGILEIHDGEE